MIVMSVSNYMENDAHGRIFVSSTELDSHANMVVIGKQVCLFSHHVQYANVQVFAKETKGVLEVPKVGKLFSL